MKHALLGLVVLAGISTAPLAGADGFPLPDCSKPIDAFISSVASAYGVNTSKDPNGEWVLPPDGAEFQYKGYHTAVDNDRMSGVLTIYVTNWMTGTCKIIGSKVTLTSS